jgi:hypothetical protein
VQFVVATALISLVVTACADAATREADKMQAVREKRLEYVYCSRSPEKWKWVETKQKCEYISRSAINLNTVLMPDNFPADVVAEVDQFMIAWVAMRDAERTKQT